MTVVASNYARKENDLYQTEPWATEALLRHLDVRSKLVWECAAGNHLMADVLRDAGALVTATDLETYDRQHDHVADFLNPPSDLLFTFEFIITNPPYGKQNRTAVKFIEQALLQTDGYVAMLLTAKFDFGSARTHLFRDNARFMAKIALLDRISWELNGQTGTEDHAWYVWAPTKFIGSASPVCLYEGKLK